MIDLLFLAFAFGFFGLAAAYIHGCEKLRGVKHD